MSITVVYREELREYDFGPGHPFRGDRYDIFPRFLQEQVPPGDLRFVTADPAGDADLHLICNDDYVRFCRDFYGAASRGETPRADSGYLSPDNLPAGRPGRLEEAARLIVGQGKAACDLVMEGDLRRVVALGGGMHHARPGYGEGFCIYNDVAFCARYLGRVHGLERVLVLDTDAHAGNGTAEYFAEDPKVLLVDLHQDPRSLYPGTGFLDEIGTGNGRGYTVNVPMPLFSGERAYRLAFDEIVLPVVDAFQPQAVVRNGGSDPHVGDQLTNLGLSVSGFRMIGETVRRICDRWDCPEIDLIGSGYNREVLPYAWMALLCGLDGIDMELPDPVPAPGWLGVDRSLGDMRVVVNELRNRLRPCWPSLA